MNARDMHSHLKFFGHGVDRSLCELHFYMVVDDPSQLSSRYCTNLNGDAWCDCV
jgi:hypothetical protein